MSNNENTKPFKRSFFSTMVAIAWSFIGLRKKKDFDADAAGGLNPLYVIIAALIATAIFIAILMVIVNFVVP